jgi:hypothetical protein
MALNIGPLPLWLRLHAGKACDGVQTSTCDRQHIHEHAPTVSGLSRHDPRARRLRKHLCAAPVVAHKPNRDVPSARKLAGYFFSEQPACCRHKQPKFSMMYSNTASRFKDFNQRQGTMQSYQTAEKVEKSVCAWIKTHQPSIQRSRCCHTSRQTSAATTHVAGSVVLVDGGVGGHLVVPVLEATRPLQSVRRRPCFGAHAQKGGGGGIDCHV